MESDEWGTPEFELRGHSSGVVRIITLVVCTLLFISSMSGVVIVMTAVVKLARLAPGQNRGGNGIVGLILLVLWGIICCGGFAYLAWFVWSRSLRDRLRVFQGGFEIVRRGTPRRVPWSEVETVRERIIAAGAGDPLTLIVALGAKLFGSLEPSCTLTLELACGETFILDNRFEKIGSFSERLRTEVVARNLHEAVRACRGGGTVDFGPVTMSENELSVSTKTIRFDEIRRIAVQSGSLRVWKHDALIRWAAIETAQIPNFDVLVALLMELGHLSAESIEG